MGGLKGLGAALGLVESHATSSYPYQFRPVIKNAAGLAERWLKNHSKRERILALMAEECCPGR